MSTTTNAPVKRRSLPVAQTTPPAQVPAEEANGQEQTEEEEEAATTNVGKVTLPEFGEVQVTDGVTELQTVRACVEDIKRQISDLFKESADLPLSKDTVYTFGEMSGHFNVLVMLLGRDIADAAQ